MPISQITRIVPEPEDNQDAFGAAIAINYVYYLKTLDMGNTYFCDRQRLT